MLPYIFSGLIGHTIVSLFLGGVLGSVIGFVIGAIRQRMDDTVSVSIVGSFLGCLLMCTVPPIFNPGTLNIGGGSGGLGYLHVLASIVLITLGGCFGSLIASTFGFRFFLNLPTKRLVWMLGGVYILMAISLSYSYLQYCSPSISYC
ncbi:hypothetical protein [Coleofasciculus sp. FACHB-1120]|uniref:hypothetical protein n=1 Tax=Coleofasciculus sp. FACHB-1120 TaxID=2692783 RepID=UPI0016852F62|nr:hypothetical protein [Coleofasciculus sp. FACHB-1120]MBD2745030.1 hypothetical protein [Coleofasciculus sp. FACHB-1120]